MKSHPELIEELKDTLADMGVSIRDFHAEHVAPYGYDYAEFLRQINTTEKLCPRVQFIISHFLERNKRADA